MLQLKEELGNKKMAKLEPPPKNRLGSVNKRPDLVEKRRRELESWLWKLIGDGEIARSQVLNKFLELSDAARLVQRYTVPNVNIVGKIIIYFRKTVITTVITANTQCRIVVTNRNYGRNDS